MAEELLVTLSRSDSEGFGFSLLGTAGLPHVIYDIVENSPAADSGKVNSYSPLFHHLYSADRAAAGTYRPDAPGVLSRSRQLPYSLAANAIIIGEHVRRLLYSISFTYAYLPTYLPTYNTCDTTCIYHLLVNAVFARAPDEHATQTGYVL